MGLYVLLSSIININKVINVNIINKKKIQKERNERV